MNRRSSIENGRPGFLAASLSMTLGAVALGGFALGTASAQDGEDSLASQARDPTASVTAFQIRYDWTANLHNAPDQDLGSIVLQPIIPFKIGGQRHIARITLPYVTHAPDLTALTGGGIDQNPIPPNYLPTRPVDGLGDTALLDMLLFDAKWGRWGVGPALTIPTATNSALGSGKWSIGPGAVAIGKSGKWQYGSLVMGLFSVAGKSDRPDVRAITVQPFASYDLGGGWSTGLSELSYTFNLQQGRWVDIPIGGRIEKLVQFGNLPVRIYVDAEYNLKRDDISPKWTFRFAFVPLFAN